MKRWLRISKAVVIVCLVIFFYFSLSGPKDSLKDFSDVQNNTLMNIDLNQFVQQDNISIKRFLALEPENYENIIYYKSNDAMKTDEIVIVKFKTNDQNLVFQQTLEKRIEDQENVFEGYAPKEADKLKKAVINIQANYAIYIVNDDFEKINSQFLESLK